MSRALFNPKYILSLGEKYNFILFFLVFLMSQRRRKKRKGSLKIHCDLSWGTFSNDDDDGGHLFLNVQAQVSEGHGAWRGNQWSFQAEKHLLLGAPLGPHHTYTIGSIVLSNTSQGSHPVLNTALPLCCSLAGNWTRPVTLHSSDINLFPLCSLIPISFPHLNTKRHDLLRVREKYIH